MREKREDEREQRNRRVWEREKESIVNLFSQGHINKDYLAAASLAFSFSTSSFFIVKGLSSTLVTFVAQAKGASILIYPSSSSFLSPSSSSPHSPTLPSLSPSPSSPPPLLLSRYSFREVEKKITLIKEDNPKLIGHSLQRALLVTGLMSIPAGCLWAFTSPILYLSTKGGRRREEGREKREEVRRGMVFL